MTTRTVFLAAASVLVCSSLATDEAEDTQGAVEDIPSKFYRCGTIMSDGKICGGVMGTGSTPIETSKKLITKIADLPSKFERPDTRQNVFRKGTWGLVASPYSDTVSSTDGQFEVDINVPDIGISTLNWSPNVDMELAYKLFIDDEEVFKSDYRIVRESDVPYMRWTKVSDELIALLEEGTTLKVKLVLRTEDVVHDDEYPLTGLSENLIAARKLQKDSPRLDHSAYEFQVVQSPYISSNIRGRSLREFTM